VLLGSVGSTLVSVPISGHMLYPPPNSLRWNLLIATNEKLSIYWNGAAKFILIGVITWIKGYDGFDWYVNINRVFSNGLNVDKSYNYKQFKELI